MWLNLLERGKRLIYLAKRDRTNKYVEVYDEPVPIKVKKIPVRTNLLIEHAGQLGKDTFIAGVPHEVGEQFSLGDRCFVKTLPPSMYNPSCGEADFRVTAKSEGDFYTEVILEGLV